MFIYLSKKVFSLTVLIIRLYALIFLCKIMALVLSVILLHFMLMNTLTIVTLNITIY